MEWKVVLETDPEVQTESDAILALLRKRLPPGVRVSAIVPAEPGMPVGRYHYLERSTALLAAGDQRLLDEDTLPVICYAYEFGYWVFVDQHAIDDGRSDLQLEFLSAGYSEGLFRVVLEARDCDCWWVRFDRDAPKAGDGSTSMGQKQMLQVG